ncbi:hypothetical protein SORBI_3K044415 [Sorghum bicolor]|uniref:Uncharacterized protein n=1 Tax=Sorghum bicolor TaxID=4558 RepID=A0A1W0VQT4_SORBI|nr:hypothetical protein SORBI_3K044415 [Sorghum bicolor]
MAAAAPPGAVVVPVAAAAQPAAGAAARNWTKVSQRWAQTLFVLGFAAAALATFSINSYPTEAEAAALRAASEELLLAAAAQVLGATTAVLLPACKLATIFATLLGSMTGYCASDVLWLLVACHGYVHGDLRVYYGFFVAMFLVALLVGLLASLGPCF